MNWVYFGQIIVKSTQLGENLVLFQKCYADGWEVRPKIGIEKVRFSRSGRHISTYDFDENNPFPGFMHGQPNLSRKSTHIQRIYLIYLLVKHEVHDLVGSNIKFTEKRFS